MKALKRFLLHLFHKPHVPPELEGYCLEAVSKQNEARFKALVPLVMAVVTLILAVYGIIILRGTAAVPLYRYLVADFGYLLFLFVCYLVWRLRLRCVERNKRLLFYAVYCGTLVWTTALSIFDKNMMTSVIGVMAFAMLFVIRPRVFFVAQLVIMLPSLFFLQVDGFTMLLNVINILCSCLLSGYAVRIVYALTLESFANKKAVEIKNEALRELSERDGLTQLYNRRLFDTILKKEWDKATRKHMGLVLLLIDIDYFKEYNDTYGHLQGDECLKILSRALRQHFQRAGEYIARYGGEELAIIMTNAEEADGVAAANRLMQVVEALEIPHSHSMVAPWVTVSAGVAADYPSIHQPVEDLIRRADVALYAAKTTGRNRFTVAE